MDKNFWKVLAILFFFLLLIAFCFDMLLDFLATLI